MKNKELENLINKWIENGDYSLIKKIIKLSSAKYFYKICKARYRETQDRFYIRSIRKIGLLYKIKAYLFSNKEKNRIKAHQDKLNKKAEKINELIKSLTKDDKFVYIMQYSFFDPKGENYFSGGGERYACDLSELIYKKGYRSILIQAGDETANKPWHNNFNNIDVIGVNAVNKEYFYIIKKLLQPSLTIYSGAIGWGKDAFHPSILISHGITWDHPLFNANTEYLKQLLTFADTFVSVDTNTLSWYRSTFSHFIANSILKMKYIPNYTDLNIYKPKENKNTHKNLRIVYPRRCSAERGFWLIVNIIPRLLNEFKNIEFDLVGYAHTPEIEEKIKELEETFPKRLHHYVLPANEMVNVYQNADISVIPTEYSEGTSLSCIEAMACGNAVVATDVGGLPNLIINNYNGLLTEPYEEDIYNAIKKLVLNKELRLKLQTNALEVSKVFSKASWDNSWKNILEKYLGNNETKTNIESTKLNDEFKEKYLKQFGDENPLKNKRNLFITTGFISTINAMSIIDSHETQNSDNYLIVYSSNVSDKFKEYNLKLILDGYFKNIIFADDSSYDENIKFIEDENFLKTFNEIYTTAQKSYDIWNKHNCINLIEEGISSYFSFENINYSNIKNIYLSNYFNKIFYLDKSQENKVRTLDKNSIKNIISRIKLQNDLNFKEFQSENLVLFLSQYIYQDFMSNEEVTNFYIKHIDTLINNNYTVLFKSHPRVNDVITENLAKYYKNNPKFKFFDAKIKYPVELMIEDLNLKAIVTSMSGGAINCSHLFDIPCYGIGAKLIKDNHPFENVRRYADVFINNIEHLKEFNRIENDLVKNK